MTKGSARVAEIGYSKDLRRLDITVPNGTRFADLAKIFDRLSTENIIGRLPRGCPQCTSGDHLNIREQLEDVIQVDLDRGELIGQTEKAAVFGQ